MRQPELARPCDDVPPPNLRRANLFFDIVQRALCSCPRFKTAWHQRVPLDERGRPSRCDAARPMTASAARRRPLSSSMTPEVGNNCERSWHRASRASEAACARRPVAAEPSARRAGRHGQQTVRLRERVEAGGEELTGPGAAAAPPLPELATVTLSPRPRAPRPRGPRGKARGRVVVTSSKGAAAEPRRNRWRCSAVQRQPRQGCGQSSSLF